MHDLQVASSRPGPSPGFRFIHACIHPPVKLGKFTVIGSSLPEAEPAIAAAENPAMRNALARRAEGGCVQTFFAVVQIHRHSRRLADGTRRICRHYSLPPPALAACSWSFRRPRQV